MGLFLALHLSILAGPYGQQGLPALPGFLGLTVLLLHPATLCSFIFVFVPQWRSAWFPLSSVLRIHPCRSSGHWSTGPVCALATPVTLAPGHAFPLFCPSSLRASPAQSHSLAFTCCCICAVLRMHLSLGAKVLGPAEVLGVKSLYLPQEGLGVSLRQEFRVLQAHMSAHSLSHSLDIVSFLIPGTYNRDCRIWHWRGRGCLGF